MEKKYYSAESLGRSLLSLERRYGMASSDFYELVVAHERVENVPGFVRSVWASLYRDYCRLCGDDFALNVERTLALA